ncbi:DUF4785 domain-containing protein [Teredinibacter haidensis]|uniref:DUF4785 domain-containing protein n=1 Tax=Teredinibacter haidensis TaxID=2731755 RepID=UPI000948B07E|nr:DUF4785 domain-containing protein [Teredinibacter haidensis]
MKLINVCLIFVVLGFASDSFGESVGKTSREKVTFVQQLEPDTKVNLEDVAVQRSSRVFFRKVTGDQLNKGIDLTLDADNAVIQLSPLDGVKKGKRVLQKKVPLGMTLSNGKQRRNVDDDSIALHRKTEGLRESHPELYGRAHAMRVPPDMGRGRFNLRANGNAAKDQEFVVYVLDKNSDIELNVSAPKTRFARSEALTIDAQVSSEQKSSVESMSAVLVSPKGKRYAVPGKMRDGRFKTAWPIDVDVSSTRGELWQVEVHSTVLNARQEPVERIAVVAADIYQQSADLVDVEAGANSLTLALNVEMSGRYEARALIYGVDYDGEQKPVMLSYQAEWLEAGAREMNVAIDPAQLAASGLKAPYEVYSVQLLDQGRMHVLENQKGHWELK